MTSLFDIGKSALNSYRQSLAVTGQNIANINTEGYKRREASLEEVVGSQGGVTSIASQSGLGVRVSDIKRSFDQYLQDRARSATANFEKLNVFVEQITQLENMMLPDEGDLGAQIASFFDSLREVAALPGETAPRTVAIEQGHSLAAGFNNYATQLEQVQNHYRNMLGDSVESLNILAKTLADVNARITASGQSGASPNSILDIRDKTLADISQLADITVSFSGRGVANVKLGSSGIGPDLVENGNAYLMGLNETFGSLQPTILSGGQQVATNQITAGIVAGLSDAYDVATESLKDVNYLAQLVSTEMNAQHREGLTLEGLAGLNMFSVSGLTISAGTANRSKVQGTVMVSDPESVPLSQMTATYSAEAEAWILTGEALENPIRGANRIVGQGFIIEISGTPAAGDTLLVDPLSGAAGNMRFLLDKASQIAASSGFLASADANNLSDALIDAEIIDSAQTTSLKKIDQIFKNSSSPIEASEFIRDGFVAEIPAGTQSLSLSSLVQQSQARFNLSTLEMSKISQLNFAIELEDGSIDGPFQFDVSYATAYPNATAGTNWSDLGELADLLNRGVLTDTLGRTLKDTGLHASGSAGVLTLASSRGNFDDSEANIARLSVGGGAVRAQLSDKIDASDIQIFTKEGRHILGNVLNDEEISAILRKDNGFSEFAHYSQDYLNQTEPAYRAMDINIARSSGMQRLVLGANGRDAAAIGGGQQLPLSDAIDQSLTINLENGLSKTVNLERSGSAVDAAEAFNRQLNDFGIHAKARLRVELSDVTDNGTVSFMLEGSNPDPLLISAQVTQSDLTNLATAINDLSSRLGITAQLSTNKKRLILESSGGQDIFISNYNEISPNIVSRVIHDDGSAASNDVVLGSENNGFDFARYSGTVTLDSVKSFSVASEDETVLTSAEDVATNGLITILSNASSDSKLINFGVNPDSDDRSASLDGLKAIAASGHYSLTLPTSDSDVQFSASVTSGDLGHITTEALNKKMVDNLRAQGPLSSHTAGQPAALAASQTFVYSGTNVIDPATDSFSVTVENTLIPVSLTAITTAPQMLSAAAAEINNAGLGVVASSETETMVEAVAQVTTIAAITTVLSSTENGDVFSLDIAGTGTITTAAVAGLAVPGAYSLSDLASAFNTANAALVTPADVTFSAGNGVLVITANQTGAAGFTASNMQWTDTSMASTITTGAIDVTVTGVDEVLEHRLTIEAGLPGESFEMGNISFSDADDAAASMSYQQSVTAKKMPINGDFVYIDYANQSYRLELVNDEIVVTGGEGGRITAYFDSENRLQIFGGGSLSGQAISVSSSEKYAGNNANAEKFGLVGNVMRFTGQPIRPTASLEHLSFSYNGVDVRAVVDGFGDVSTVPVGLPDGLDLQFEMAAGASEGRLIITYDSAMADLQFDMPQDRLGIKVADIDLSVGVEGIRATSHSGDVLEVEATASSLVDQKITFNDLIVEDLLVFVTGNGARQLNSQFDIPEDGNLSVLNQRLDEKGLVIKSLSDDGLQFEILDKETGHSIATRTLSEDRQLEFDKYQFTIRGDAVADDQFFFSRTASGTGDARNLEKLIRLQEKGSEEKGTEGFSSIFSNMIAGIGASVSASKLAKEGAEATKEAALESESEFSGVNLDSEAAALIEFQQAYQASARILSTARELFQTLIDVV